MQCYFIRQAVVAASKCDPDYVIQFYTYFEHLFQTVPVNVLEQQQDFGRMFGINSSIAYDCYDTKEMLEEKLQLFYPGTKRQDISQRNDIVNALWNQRHYAGSECLFMAPICVTMVYDHDSDIGTALHRINSKEYDMHLVFRVRKCNPNPVHKKCCAIFVDSEARVYPNWLLFKDKNNFRNGLMVAPVDGAYVNDPKNSAREFSMEIHWRKKLVKYFDIGSTVVSLTATAIELAVIIPAIPVLPAIAMGGVVAGGLTAGYVAIRSACDLVDRSQHEQSISLKNENARQNWLSIGAGVVTVSAAGIKTVLLRKNPALKATNMKTAFQGCNITCVTVCSLSFLNSVYTTIGKYQNGEKISALEYAQLSSGLFLLTHSMRNTLMADELLSTNKTVESFNTNCFTYRTSDGTAATDCSNQYGHFLLRSGKCLTLVSSIVSRRVQNLIDKYIKSLTDKFEFRSLNDLKLTLINILEDLSISVFREFMNLFDHIAASGGRFLRDIGSIEDLIKLVFQDHKRSNTKSGALDQMCSTVATQWIRQKASIFYQQGEDYITQYFRGLKKEAKEKLRLFEEIDSIQNNLMLESKVPYNSANVREAIKEIRINLSIEATKCLFVIVKKFVEKHAADIQTFLERSIPLDYFINDIYNILCKVSDTNLDSYLMEFGMKHFDAVENDILAYYRKQMIGGDVVKCKDCQGQYRVKSKQQ